MQSQGAHAAARWSECRNTSEASSLLGASGRRCSFESPLRAIILLKILLKAAEDLCELAGGRRRSWHLLASKQRKLSSAHRCRRATESRVLTLKYSCCINHPLTSAKQAVLCSLTEKCAPSFFRSNIVQDDDAQSAAAPRLFDMRLPVRSLRGPCWQVCVARAGHETFPADGQNGLTGPFDVFRGHDNGPSDVYMRFGGGRFGTGLVGEGSPSGVRCRARGCAGRATLLHASMPSTKERIRRPCRRIRQMSPAGESSPSTWSPGARARRDHPDLRHPCRQSSLPYPWSSRTRTIRASRLAPCA